MNTQRYRLLRRRRRERIEWRRAFFLTKGNESCPPLNPISFYGVWETDKRPTVAAAGGQNFSFLCVCVLCLRCDVHQLNVTCAPARADLVMGQANFPDGAAPLLLLMGPIWRSHSRPPITCHLFIFVVFYFDILNVDSCSKSLLL